MTTITDITHLTMVELEAGLYFMRQAPKDEGVLEAIIRRPQKGGRESLEEGELDTAKGLVGDNWKTRGSGRTDSGAAHLDMQLTIMNARAIAHISPDTERRQLAGDQLFIDLDLSGENLPPGTRLSIGSAVVEVTAEPHTGCKQFVARFGLDAMKFVNSPQGKALNLRGINTKVVQSGTIRVGDSAKKAS
jgi:MOSC domain-containing protein YiiM